MPRREAHSADLQVALIGVSSAGGWYELVLSGVDREAGRKLSLILELGPGSHVIREYALPAAGGGALRQIVHLDRPVLSARLVSAFPLYMERAELRRIGRLGVLSRGLARDRQQTLEALRWRLAGKKVRARNMLMRLFGQPRRMAYQEWLGRERAARDGEVQALVRALQAGQPAGVSVIIHSCPDGEASAETLASLKVQLQPASHIAVVGRDEPLASYIAGASSDWIVLLPDGHALAPDALLRIASQTARTPAPAALTWDSDRVDGSGRHREPELKPRWNEALYLARDYVGPFAFSRAAAVRGSSELPAMPTRLPDAFLLAAAHSASGDVGHIARVLSHRVDDCNPSPIHLEQRRHLVESVLRAESPAAAATLEPGGIVRAQFAVSASKPLVSLIVPTRDRMDLLEPCVEGLLHRTNYADIEVLIADNGSFRADTHRYFERIVRDRRVRVIDCAGPFNFSAINNRAVAASRGTVLGFINNDIEVLGADWLDEMVGHALRPRIGAVGAKLLYPSGLVQHAGVVLGIGGYAGHAHRFAHPGDWGYLGRLQAQQYFTAVTAASLVVEKSKFDAVGGFDAEAFPVAYNDVDLCLRLRAAGHETLWTPYAELLHKESASRAKDYSPERKAAYDLECRAFKQRWADLIADDPCYHPALSRTLENFSLE